MMAQKQQEGRGEPYTRPITPITNPLDDPRVRAVFHQAIIENMNYKLDRHLGKIIEEMFQERTTSESE